MADLLNSLVVPSSPRSSQDSFRSLSSQPRTQSASPPPSKSQAISTGPLPFQDPAFQAASLPVYDIDSYLAQNAGLRSTPSNTKKASKRPAPANTGSPEPVSLGTKTGGFAVATLNTQCQIKGFLPAFEIDGVSDFGGALKLRDVTVTSDQRWSSKKEAKEGLAEKGLERLKSMEATSKEPGVPQEVGKNWVGMLHGKSIRSCRSLCS